MKLRRREDSKEDNESKPKLRLFLGTLLDDEMKEICSSRLMHNQVNWTPVNNLHLTWQFLGDQDESKLRQLKNFIKEIEAIYFPIKVQLKDIRIWPNEDTPKVFAWCGEIVSIAGSSENIETNRKRFFKDFNQRLAKICDFNARESFIPHVTLARFKKGTRFNQIKVFKDYALPQKRWEIDHMDLVLSERNPNSSPEYKAL